MDTPAALLISIRTLVIVLIYTQCCRSSGPAATHDLEPESLAMRLADTCVFPLIGLTSWTILVDVGL